MSFRNIIHSVVIVLTVILCFVYVQKKGFSFNTHINVPNWNSFPIEKLKPTDKENSPKSEDKKEPKKDEKIEKKPEPKSEPKSESKPESKPQPKEELEEKSQEESVPQNSRPRFFRRGRVIECLPGGS